MYCVKCKKSVEPSKTTKVVSGKRAMLKANCPHCDTKMNQFVKNSSSTEEKTESKDKKPNENSAE